MQKNSWAMGRCYNKKPKDFVISTGKTYDIKHFINISTDYLGLKTKDWKRRNEN